MPGFRQSSNTIRASTRRGRRDSHGNCCAAPAQNARKQAKAASHGCFCWGAAGRYLQENCLRPANKGGKHAKYCLWAAITSRAYFSGPQPTTTGERSRRSPTGSKVLGSEGRPAPTSTQFFLEKIEAVLRDHSVIVFAQPTPGMRLATDIVVARVDRTLDAVP